MSYLMDINEDVQKIAEVIENVLKVDVTIVDDSFKRVAGTGRYKGLIESSISEGTVFEKAINTGCSYFVDSPRDSSLCDMCSNKSNCAEFAEVCCPIVYDKRSIGVIGLVAFEENQKEALLINKDSLLQFLNQMAGLISSKVHERDSLAKNNLLRKQLETIIDTIDEGIIAVDSRGNITHCSFSAKKYLKVNSSEIIGKNINIAFPEFSIEIDSLKNQNISNKEFVLKKNNHMRGLLSTRAIFSEGNYSGAVIVIRTISDIRKVINHISSLDLNISFDDIIGTSRLILDVKDKAIKASNGNSTVFIMGESGTGKELFARAIHSLSNRKEKPFIAVNCAAIPEALLESELFGYEEGAFTGAKKGGKIGKFELANGGTIFLDEIGDMPLHLQTKLLRVLQDRAIERVGGQYAIAVDVRVVAATHKDIFTMLRYGEFRHDLFYRLNVIPITIPPLRERKEDIPLLMTFMLKKCCIKLNKPIKDFSDEVYKTFMEYDWNGNIRELENTIEYAVNMEPSYCITKNSLPPRFKVEESRPGSRDIIPVNELEKEAIIKALDILGHDKKDEAAKALGMGRATLYRKIKEYSIISK